MLDPAVQAGFRRRAVAAAMAELCAEQGYLGTSVADVAARAETSRSTVYGLFANREAIFLALLDRGVGEVLGLAEGACGRAGPDPRARIEAAIRAILNWVAEHPKEAHAFLVEAQSATPEALRQYHEAISDLAALLATAVPTGKAGSLRLEEIIVGGLAAVLARWVSTSQLGPLSTLELAPPLSEPRLTLSAPTEREKRRSGGSDESGAVRADQA